MLIEVQFLLTIYIDGVISHKYINLCILEIVIFILIPLNVRKPQYPLVWSTSGQWISRRDILVEGLIPLSPNFQITQFSSQFKLRIKAHNVRSILRLLKLRINFRKVGLDGLRLEDHKTWVCWFLFSVLRIIFGEYYIW